MRRSIAFIFILLVAFSIVNAFPSIRKRDGGDGGYGGNSGNDGGDGGNSGNDGNGGSSGNDGNGGNDGGNNDNGNGFQPCPFGPLKVKVNPDPPVPGKNATYDIRGNLDTTIPDGSKIGVLFANGTDFFGQPSVKSFCNSDNIKCPVQPNTDFNTTDQVLTPNNLPDKYAILVAILYQNQTANDTRILGCAYDLVGFNQQDSSSYKSSLSSSSWSG